MIQLALAVDPSLYYALGAIGAAIIAAIVTMLTTRALVPSQKKQLAAATAASAVSAAEAAVRSVQVALGEAQDKIKTLEHKVVDLTRKISALHEELQVTISGRESLEQRLNFALAERAALKQKITDLELRLAGGGGAMGLGEPDAIIMTDLTTGEIYYTSDGVYDLFGYTPKELIGQNVNVLVPEHLRDIHDHERIGYSHHPRTRPMGTGIALLGLKRDGTVIPIDISLHPTSDGRVIALIKAKRPTDIPVDEPSVGARESSKPTTDMT